MMFIILCLIALNVYTVCIAWSLRKKVFKATLDASIYRQWALAKARRAMNHL